MKGNIAEKHNEENTMNYNEAKQYLKEVNKYGSVLGLKSITTLLKEMGNPEKSLKVVHIAGTNGKGSTMAFLNSILMEASPPDCDRSGRGD